jgi:hypothetical protein
MDAVKGFFQKKSADRRFKKAGPGIAICFLVASPSELFCAKGRALGDDGEAVEDTSAVAASTVGLVAYCI